MPTLKRLVAKLILSTISVLVMLLLSEVALRLYDLKTGRFSSQFYPYTSAQFVLEDLSARVPHLSWHHGLLPDYVADDYLADPDTKLPVACRINRDGFRDRDFEYHDDELRVFFIGDSFTEGYFLKQEEAIPQQTESILRAHSVNDGRVRSFNFGCGSYSPLLCYRILRCYIDRFRPHMVIYLMNWGDAFDDAYFGYAKCFEYDADGRPTWMNKQTTRTRTLDSHPGLKINSYLFLAATQWLDALQNERRAGPVANGSENPADWSVIRATQLWYAIDPAADPGVLKAIYEEAFKPVAAMKDLALAASADFIVIYIPAPWEASDCESPSSPELSAVRLLPRIRPLMKDKGYYEARNEPVLAEVAKQYGFRLEVPLDALRREAGLQRLYFVHDCHLNAAGAAFYAKLCAGIVAEAAGASRTQVSMIED